MKRKYIKDLNISFEDTPQGWNPKDSRQLFWQRQKAQCGFDEREVWSLDYSFNLWLYERLSMFNEVNTLDTNSPVYEYKEMTLSLQDCIDRMLDGLRLDLTLPEYSPEREKNSELISDVTSLFALCLKDLWY